MPGLRGAWTPLRLAAWPKTGHPGTEGRYGEGVPCWVDAQLPDVEAGKRFYGELFGWTFEEASYGGSTVGPAGRRAGRRARPQDGRPHAHRLDGVLRHPGRRGPRRPDLGGRRAGRHRAPAGRRPGHVARWSPTPRAPSSASGSRARHRGFGIRHEPGTFAWAELYARDTEAANTFYGGLFHDALFGPDAHPDFGRAPVSDVFPAEMPPHFLVHFASRTARPLLGTVNRLGGRVQAPPFETSYGQVAVVTDNQGASFALLER